MEGYQRQKMVNIQTPEPFIHELGGLYIYKVYIYIQHFIYIYMPYIYIIYI